MIDRLIGMDSGTRARTVAAVVTGALDCLSAFGVIEFSDEKVQAIQKIALAIVTAFVWLYLSHYKNNDFTSEAAEATGEMRAAKKAKKGKDYAITEEVGGDVDAGSEVDEEL